MLDPALAMAPCGYVRFLEDGQIIQVNQTLAHWMNQTPGGLIGQNLLSWLPKSGQIFFQTHVFPQIKLGGMLEECYFNLLVDGSTRMPMLGNFQRSAGGTLGDLDSYDAMFMRIAKRYELEDAIVRAKHVADEAVEALHKSNDALSRFVGMVAHDLKMPIRNMTAFSQMVMEDYAYVLDDMGKRDLQRIQETGHRALYFMDKLLEYGRLTTQANQTMQGVDLNQVVAIACENLAVTIAETDTQIEVKNLPTVLGFPTQLEQLFQNLINNAIKYRDPNRRPVIQLSAVPLTGQTWKIWIADNGLGIDPVYHQCIFEPMRRLHGTEYEGAGLGLATCQWIVDNHHGVLGVESVPGQGSQFYFTLPVLPLFPSPVPC